MKKLFVTLALVTAAFALAQHQNMPNKPMRDMEQMKQKQQEHLDKMQKNLNLTSAQVQQIKALQDKHFSEMEANHEKNIDSGAVSKMAETER